MPKRKKIRKKGKKGKRLGGQGPAVAPLGLAKKVKAHVPGVGDLYCVYPVTVASPGAPIPVGANICLWCPNPAKIFKCDVVWKFEMTKKIWYKVGGAANLICTTCPDLRYSYEETRQVPED